MYNGSGLYICYYLSIIVGCHVFSLKYLDISIQTHENKNIKYFFVIIYNTNRNSK